MEFSSTQHLHLLSAVRGGEFVEEPPCCRILHINLKSVVVGTGVPAESTDIGFFRPFQTST